MPFTCPQAWTLLLVGPFIDKLASSDWVFNYTFTQGAPPGGAGAWGVALLAGQQAGRVCLLAHMAILAAAAVALQQ